MLYELRFKNFRSYKSEAILDLSAKPINEFSDSLIKANDEVRLLPVSAIYGPNGGGKSGVLIALETLRAIVTEPLIQLAFMKQKNEKLTDASIEELQNTINIQKSEDFYYKWDDECDKAPSEFNVLYQVKEKKFRYELAILNGNIIEENLFLENINNNEITSVFERDSEGVFLSEEIGEIDIEKMNESLPLLSYIAMFKNVEKIDQAIQFFLNMRIMDFDKPRMDRSINVKALEKDKKRILAVIRSMGIDICDLRIVYNEDNKVKKVYTKHQLAGGNYKELGLNEESSGTRKIFSILTSMLRGIDGGSFFVLDELDAKLHPMLLKKIIELFTDPKINQNGAQLLFTSHDLTTMSKDVFRRDEIWFSAINAYDESVLYSLVDFRKENGKKPRNDENYNKQYLEGHYGADPYMKCLQD